MSTDTTTAPDASAALGAAASFLGPAMVTAVHPQGACICLVDGVTRDVVLAMPLQYRPVVGDVLLVVGTTREHWAIGVIQGRGETRLATGGAIELDAGTALRLRARTEIDLDSPRTRVRGRQLELDAERITASARDWVQRIAGLLRVAAGRRSTRVQDSDITHCGSTTTKARGRVAIDGERIDLG